MDAILIDIENTHGDLLNDILLTVGCPIRWLAIRDINDFDNILQKNIIAIYCLPFAMDGVSTKSLNKIIELQEQGAIFITPLDNDKNDLAQVCNFVVTKPITWEIKDQGRYFSLTGVSAACAFWTLKKYLENKKED